MSRQEAEKAALHMVMSGYRHHAYEDERANYQRVLSYERDAFIEYLNTDFIQETANLYIDIMGPTRLRSLKNTIICSTTCICRFSIEEGVNTEFSFALSDYYINQIELTHCEEALRQLAREIMLHYYDLVKKEKMRICSKPIASAIRYIGRNLHGICPITDVADFVGLEIHYFTSLFSRQVGVSPGRYIRLLKLTEAKRMLEYVGTSVTETAETLGFCDIAHFSKSFKKVFGVTPSAVRKGSPF